MCSVSVLIDDFENSLACLLEQKGKVVELSVCMISCVFVCFYLLITPVKPSFCGSASKLLLMRRLLKCHWNWRIFVIIFCETYSGNSL